MDSPQKKERSSKNTPFWRRKTLAEMTEEEWEAVCDGCGRCCLHKLEDKETGEVSYTGVACRLLDIDRCRCRDYPNRTAEENVCLTMTPQTIFAFPWLPKTCGYRLLFEGKELPSWHPLVTGDPESVHEAGISLRNKAVSEAYIDTEDLRPFIIDIDF